MKKLIIIGAGGHGSVVADCAEQLASYSEIVFLDDAFPQKKANHHWQVVGKIADFGHYLSDDFIVAIGSNSLRYNILNELKIRRANIVSLVHPSAYVSPYATIKPGVVVFANAVINVGSEIGTGTIINTSATVDHDCHLGECVHISPGVNIAGGVKIGDFSWLGIGCSVIHNIHLADNIQIGAGATVLSAEQPNAIYVGTPAKAIKQLKEI